MTREVAVAEATLTARARGHVLHTWTWDQGYRKWHTSCQTCGAMALVERSGSEWTTAGSTQTRSCAAIQRSKRKRVKNREAKSRTRSSGD